uniref:Cocaine- and amphetamine-regulated transcript protein n=1 Tax=Varanus komodoensis TaxID=61221 RepID=A0A8D2L0U9_VARKO
GVWGRIRSPALPGDARGNESRNLPAKSGLAAELPPSPASPHKLVLLSSHEPHLSGQWPGLDELQEVLEKLQHKKVSTWEKKFNQVPKCSFGDACAVRKGARIGKLCDCPRGSACNAFFLKCL